MLKKHKDAIWEKGRVIVGQDRNVLRKDALGKVMRYEEYNDKDALYGWEFEHISREGGSADVSKIRPIAINGSQQPD